MGKFYQCIQSYSPSFMTKFCSALYLENLLTNIFTKSNLRGGVSCMPAALLFQIMSEYDQTFDPNILIGHCDLISRFSDFVLYLDTQLVYFHTFFRL